MIHDSIYARKRFSLNQKILTLWSVLSFLIFILGGCVSSEETGAGDRARTPVKTYGPIDTMYHSNQFEGERVSDHSLRNETQKGSERSSHFAPKFRSKQDTVKASVIKKMKSISQQGKSLARPENPFYTVQIGAFRQASNALRMQKKARSRFSDIPVFNRYVKSGRFYRVSIGRHEEKKKAFAFADSLKKKYPHEYKQCWVNFIP